ncbi:uncharacterized protein [Scyliorhinus torazame]|uniref:uncharacterized protein n=1 Tax=Scyliorhinus torazame TaxID=75743 RepID=UPI003B59ADE4
MGTSRDVSVWNLILIISFSYGSVTLGYESRKPALFHKSVVLFPDQSSAQVYASRNPDHNFRVCSTWGNYHFKTFDGDVYYFPGTCNYVFASQCLSSYEEFNIQMRRSIVNALPKITQIVLKIDGSVIEVLNSVISVDDNVVTLPHTHSGIMIEKVSNYTRITAKIGLTLMWNGDDAITLELSQKFVNTTCGLCGDFNGIRDNEFSSNGFHLTPIQYGNLQKLNGPTEKCKDVPSSDSNKDCSRFESMCERTLTDPSFSNCHNILDLAPFIKSCMLDMCLCKNLEKPSSCICNTLSEYSRQCAHVGGKPSNWRSKDMCEETCQFNMTYEECGVPCADTCSNPDRSQMCDDHCVDGCFCAPNTVLDDISHSGCIPKEQCPCTYNGLSYALGQSYSTKCSKCTCNGGQWSCTDLSCPGICSIEGGAHINTFDESYYTFHGRCHYVLAKDCRNTLFTVLGELQQCGVTDSETCLKTVSLTLHGAHSIIAINPSGSISVNGIFTQLPVTIANVTIFKPSGFHVIVHTTFGLQLQVQLVPLMQLYITLDSSFKRYMCGLCGNFNDVLNDEFKVFSGLVEGSSAAFANTWKTKARCPDRKDIHENPCSLSVENERYAKHWCGLLIADNSAFAQCHSHINPNQYHEQCKYDSCNCEKSEDCMCAALSSYVQACALKGIIISNWRDNVCSKYLNCPKTLVYSYNMTSCQRTCQSLGAPDKTCEIDIAPVDGCGCADGTYMEDTGKCVPASHCPCYYRGLAVPAGETIHDEAALCTCNQGKLECIGGESHSQACVAPLVYFDCNNKSADSIGTECQKSCQTLDMECYATGCTSGCMCPEGLISDESGGCIPISECPCTHNGIQYHSGDIVQVDCNSCECKNRLWSCTEQQCHGTCMIYGDGNYITFDGKRYNFNGDCEYIVAQDYCGNKSSSGTFRIITENIPCGTTGTTCSKSIKIFLGNVEIKLSDGKYDVVKFGSSKHIPYVVRYLGLYLVIEAKNGLVLIWDKKTSLTIKLSHSFTRTICGLCGNYDGNVHNDFTTRNQLVVVNMEEFGNSWKVSPACMNVKKNKDPCSINVHRDAWAQKQCSILKSKPFKACNSQINPTPFYEACVRDACACDSGGDCECLCTAITAYSLACSTVGVCISWRNPEFCPLFCDYYDTDDKCEWHYAPCGIPCLKTCRNPGGACSKVIPKLEGCYPDCPDDEPILDEDKMECVKLDDCPCYVNGNHYEPDHDVPSTQNCESCKCKNSEVECTYDKSACTCIYDGKTFHEGDIIYHTTDGIGGCIEAVCGVNGTIIRKVYPCTPRTSAIPSTTLAFETTSPPKTTSTTKSTSEPNETTLTTTSTTIPIISTSTKTAHVTTEKTLTSKTATTPTTSLSTTPAQTIETTSEQSQSTLTTTSPSTTVFPTTAATSTTSSPTPSTTVIPTSTSTLAPSSPKTSTTVMPTTTPTSTTTSPTTSNTVIPPTTSTTSSPTTSTTVIQTTTSASTTSSPTTSTTVIPPTTSTSTTSSPITATTVIPTTTSALTTSSPTTSTTVIPPNTSTSTTSSPTTIVPTTTSASTTSSSTSTTVIPTTTSASTTSSPTTVIPTTTSASTTSSPTTATTVIPTTTSVSTTSSSPTTETTVIPTTTSVSTTSSSPTTETKAIPTTTSVSTTSSTTKVIPTTTIALITSSPTTVIHTTTKASTTSSPTTVIRTTTTASTTSSPTTVIRTTTTASTTSSPTTVIPTTTTASTTSSPTTVVPTTTSASTTSSPTTVVPTTTTASTTSSPTTVVPTTTTASTTSSPTTVIPTTTTASTTSSPTTVVPTTTSASTTSSPTTVVPTTTTASTTSSPTTVVPTTTTASTTSSPTTVVPTTTSASTTSSPTTVVPTTTTASTTSSPTTVIPTTTSASTTSSPTTVVPTTTSASTTSSPISTTAIPETTSVSTTSSPTTATTVISTTSTSTTSSPTPSTTVIPTSSASTTSSPTPATTVILTTTSALTTSSTTTVIPTTTSASTTSSPTTATTVIPTTTSASTTSSPIPSTTVIPTSSASTTSSPTPATTVIPTTSASTTSSPIPSTTDIPTSSASTTSSPTPATTVIPPTTSASTTSSPTTATTVIPTATSASTTSSPTTATTVIPTSSASTTSSPTISTTVIPPTTSASTTSSPTTATTVIPTTTSASTTSSPTTVIPTTISTSTTSSPTTSTTVIPTTTSASTTSSPIPSTTIIPTTTSASTTSSPTTSTTVIPTTTSASTTSSPIPSTTIIPTTTSASTTSSPTTSTTVIPTATSASTTSSPTISTTVIPPTTSASTTSSPTTATTVIPTTTSASTTSSPTTATTVIPTTSASTTSSPTTVIPTTISTSTTSSPTTSTTVIPTTTSASTTSSPKTSTAVNPTTTSASTTSSPTTAIPTTISTSTTSSPTTSTVIPTTTSASTTSSPTRAPVTSTITTSSPTTFTLTTSAIPNPSSATTKISPTTAATSTSSSASTTITPTSTILTKIVHFTTATPPVTAPLKLPTTITPIVTTLSTLTTETTSGQSETTSATSLPSTICSCSVNGKMLSPGQAIVTSSKSGVCNFTLCTKSCEILKYTGKCHTTTAPSTTLEPTTTVTVTPSTTETTSCSCTVNGEVLSPGQAIVTSSRSGVCNFTLCTKSCEILKYTGKCHTTTAPSTTLEPTTTVTVTPSTTETTSCSCTVNGEILSPGKCIRY